MTQPSGASRPQPSPREAMEPYRETATRMVGLAPQPQNHSTDNGPLFSSTYVLLLPPKEQANERIWWMGLVADLLNADCTLNRYPGDTTDLTSLDCITGVAACSYVLGTHHARLLYDYYIRHNGNINNTRPGEWTWRAWLTRFVGFGPFLRAAAGRELNLFHQVWAGLGFLCNLWEPREETSGKCLLFLRARVLYGKGFLLDVFIALWVMRMIRLYPGGMRDVYAIYFPTNPWFETYAPKEFV